MRTHQMFIVTVIGFIGLLTAPVGAALLDGTDDMHWPTTTVSVTVADGATSQGQHPEDMHW